jgi:hypothetical protein
MLEIWYNIVDESFNMPHGDTKKVFSPATTYLLGKETMHPLFILYNNSPYALGDSIPNII